MVVLCFLQELSIQTNTNFLRQVGGNVAVDQNSPPDPSPLRGHLEYPGPGAGPGSPPAARAALYPRSAPRWSPERNSAPGSVSAPAMGEVATGAAARKTTMRPHNAEDTRGRWEDRGIGRWGRGYFDCWGNHRESAGSTKH